MRRRDFLLAGAAGLSGLSARKLLAQRAPLLGAIGLQLYTVRDLAKADLARTLAAVAGAGYKEVEFAGLHGHPAAAVRRMLRDNGLTSPSGHVTLPNLGDTWEIFLEDAVTLGQRYITFTWIDAPDRTADGYRRVAARFNEAALKARGENLQFAYHNYSYEFTPLPGGMTGLAILLRECPPENLAIEADVFWMREAGQDPVAWFARFPGRFHMLHLKDMKKSPKKEMTEVGAGMMDWPRVIRAAKNAGAIHFFVEHDEPKDPMKSIAQSYRYLRSLPAGTLKVNRT